MRARWGVWLGLGVAISASAAPRREPPPPAQLDDPCVDGTDAACKRHALDGFTSALAAQRAGKADHVLRISYIGDSLTADDEITNTLRGKLHELVGDGGPGFVWAMTPHPYCQHHAITRTSTGVWRVHGVSTVQPADRLLGLGGSAESEGEASVKLVATSPVHSVELHYLAQPHGGSLAVAANGTVISTIDTAAARKQAGFATIVVPDGTKRVELRARGHVRLFGASLEAATGAVVDNLGIVNSTAKQLRTHNLPEHWEKQLAHRAPDLVIVMLGTNEAEWIPAKSTAMTEHEQLFGEALASVRTANPLAACLVVSPLDQLDAKDEKLTPRASVPAMVAAQHRAALAHGCAFWDAYAWMGGKGASAAWYRRRLLMTDYQHPTSEGAALIGAALFAGLVR